LAELSPVPLIGNKVARSMYRTPPYQPQPQWRGQRCQPPDQQQQRWCPCRRWCPYQP